VLAVDPPHHRSGRQRRAAAEAAGVCHADSDTMRRRRPRVARGGFAHCRAGNRQFWLLSALRTILYKSAVQKRFTVENAKDAEAA
jgi:hypothetical protein